MTKLPLILIAALALSGCASDGAPFAGEYRHAGSIEEYHPLP